MKNIYDKTYLMIEHCLSSYLLSCSLGCLFHSIYLSFIKAVHNIGRLSKHKKITALFKMTILLWKETVHALNWWVTVLSI